MQKKEHIAITYIETSLGLMVAAATDKGICMFEYADNKDLDTQFKQLTKSLKLALVEGHHPLFDKLHQQLDAYFKGELKQFDLPLDMVGTEFQQEVWQSLLKIPYGTTMSYAQQANLIGRPKAVRAVANANGSNKISIIIPCHRVIGSDSTLTGYGGGLWCKEKLLELEGCR